MKGIIRKTTAWMLAMAMVFAFVPVMNQPVYALSAKRVSKVSRVAPTKKATYKMKVGETKTFTVRLDPKKLSKKDRKVTFKSSRKALTIGRVKYTTKGNVTYVSVRVKAKKTGKATITAKAASGKKTRWKVSVSKPVTSGEVSVSTQKELEEALKTLKEGVLTISSQGNDSFRIPQSSFENIELVVDVPNGDVYNYGLFKKVTINEIKSSTYYEYANGNIIFVYDDDATLDLGRAPAEVNALSGGKINIKVNDNARNFRIIISNSTDVVLTGAEGDGINVEITDANCELTSNIKTHIDITAESGSPKIQLLEGAEDTTITAKSKDQVSSVENRTSGDIAYDILDGSGEEEDTGDDPGDGGGSGSGGSGGSSGGGSGSGEPADPEKKIVKSVSIDNTKPEVGDTLTATVLPAGATVAFQWYREGSSIAGETSAKYVVKPEDVGNSISVRATGKGEYTGSVTASVVGLKTYEPIEPTNGSGSVRVSKKSGEIQIGSYIDTLTLELETGFRINNNEDDDYYQNYNYEYVIEFIHGDGGKTSREKHRVIAMRPIKESAGTDRKSH